MKLAYKSKECSRHAASKTLAEPLTSMHGRNAANIPKKKIEDIPPALNWYINSQEQQCYVRNLSKLEKAVVDA